MSTLPDYSNTEQEAALSLLSSSLSSELVVLPQQIANTGDVSAAQISAADSSGEAPGNHIQSSNQNVPFNTLSEVHCGTSCLNSPDSTTAVQEAKDRNFTLKLSEYSLEESILSAKPVADYLQVPHCSSSESYLLGDSKTSSSFRHHDVQHCRAKYPQSCPVLLSQQKKILPRSQTSSPPQKVCLSLQETQVSSEKEGSPLKKVCLLPHNRAGRKQSELPVFQQDEVPQKSAPPKPRSSFQAVFARREVDKLPPLSFTEEGQSSDEAYIPPGESPAPSGQNRLNQEKNGLVEPTKICIPHKKNMQKEQIDDNAHQQTQVSLLPIFSSRSETIFTHDQAIKISQQINESCSKDKYLQQQDEVSLRANKTLQSSLYQQPQASDNGDAACPDQSHQDGRVPEKENISQDQVCLPQTEEYNTPGSKRLSQSEDGSLMGKRVVFSNASPCDNTKHLSYMRRSEDVQQHHRDSPLHGNEPDDACLIVDECSVSSVDVVNLSNAPPWEQDKLSMTQDLREATENLEKSLSLLKKQQELHFQQQQLRFGEHYVFSSDHSSELELLNKKLLLESHDDAAPLDAIRSHTIFHPCYSQRASNVLDQNMLILELTQNSRCDAFSFNDVTTASSIDLPNDFSEVLDYSLPARSDRLLDMNLPTDLSVVHDYPSKPSNTEVSGKAISSFSEAFSDTTPGAVLMTEEDAAQPTDLSVSTEQRKRRSEFNDLTESVSGRAQSSIIGGYCKADSYSLCCDSRELIGLAHHSESSGESLNSIANRTLSPEYSDRLLKNVTEDPSQKLLSMKYMTKNRRRDCSARRGSHRKFVKRKIIRHDSVKQSTREGSKLDSDDGEDIDYLDGSVAESCSAAVDVVYDLSLSNVDLFEKSKKEVVQIHSSSSWNSSLMSNAGTNPVHIYQLDEPTISAATIVEDNQDITIQTYDECTTNRSDSLWECTESHPEDLTICSGDALNTMSSGAVLTTPPLQARSSASTSSWHSSLVQASLSLDASVPSLVHSSIVSDTAPPSAVALASVSTTSEFTSNVAHSSDLQNTCVDTSVLRVACDASDKSVLRPYGNHTGSDAILCSAANASQAMLCEVSCDSSFRLLHAESKPQNSELSLSEDSDLTSNVSRENKDSQDDGAAATVSESSKFLESYCSRLKPATCKPINNQLTTSISSRKKRQLKTNKKISKPIKKRTGKKIGQDIIGSTGERKNGRYNCSYCGLQFLHKVSFVKHVRGHSANSCSQCPSNFSSRKALHQHCRLVHSLSIAITSYSCDTCSRTFTKRPLLYAHQAKHHTSPDQHRCGKCGSLLPNLLALSQHLERHSSAELPCGLCDATFSRKQQLLHHQQGHKRNKCPLCGTPCSSRKQLLQHTKTAHPPCTPKTACPVKTACPHHPSNALVGTSSKACSVPTCFNNNNNNESCGVGRWDDAATAQEETVEIMQKTSVDSETSEIIKGGRTEISSMNRLQSSGDFLANNLLSNVQFDGGKIPSNQIVEQTINSYNKVVSPGVYNKLMDSRIPSLNSHPEVFSNVSNQGILKDNHKQSVEVFTDSAVSDDIQPLEQKSRVVTQDQAITHLASNEATFPMDCRPVNTARIAADSGPPVMFYFTNGTAARKDCAPSVAVCHGGGHSLAPCRSEGCVCLPPSLRAPVHACSRCPRVFPRPCLLRDHQAFHDGVGAVRCDCCDKTFTSRRGYRKHLASRQHVVAAAGEKATAAGGEQSAAPDGREENKAKATGVDRFVQRRASADGSEDGPWDGDIRGDETHATATKEDDDRLMEADPGMSKQNCSKEAHEMNSSTKNAKTVGGRRIKSRKGITADHVVGKSSAGIVGENIEVTSQSKSRSSLIGCKTNSSTEKVDVTKKNGIQSVPAKSRESYTRFTKRLCDSASEGYSNEKRLKTAAFSTYPKVKTSSINRGKKRRTSSKKDVERCAEESGLNLSDECAARLSFNDRLGVKDGVSLSTSNFTVQKRPYVTKRQRFLAKENDKDETSEQNSESISSSVLNILNCAPDKKAKPVLGNEIRCGKSPTLLVSSGASPQRGVVSSTEGLCCYGTTSLAAKENELLDEYKQDINTMSGTATSHIERGATVAQERSFASGGGSSTDATAIIRSPTRTNMDGTSHEAVLSSSGGNGDSLACGQPRKTFINSLDGAPQVFRPVSLVPHPPVKISQPGLVNRNNVYYAGAGCNLNSVKGNRDVCYSRSGICDTSVNNESDVRSVRHEAQLSKPISLGTYCDAINHSRREPGPGTRLVSSSVDQFPSEGVCRIITSTVDDTGTLRHAVLSSSSSASVVAPTSLVISVVSSTLVPVGDGRRSYTLSSSTPSPVSGDLPSSTLLSSTLPLVSDLQSFSPSLSTPPVNAPLPSCPPSSTNVLPTELLPPAPSLPKLQCSYCDYSTHRKYSLQRHIDTHFNRRRFVCEACGKAFQSLLNLKEHHAFLHSSQRNFQCDKCSLTFKNKSTLVRHVRQRHGNTKPYSCQCGNSFKRVTHLKRHMLVVHNEAPKLQKRAKVIFSNDSTRPICKESALVQSRDQSK